MTEPRSSLVSAFNERYTEDLAAANERGATSITTAEQALEQIEAFLRVGWTGNATDHIIEFEREYGVDFEELVADVPNLEDPR